ncbi:hypothetical protein [Paenibacillus sp. 8b26]|uniref:hypothetical protein n=1 Tax=Paenibacillus sp. 8b26 TaxID=3424133 RepID=UPI003D64AF80
MANVNAAVQRLMDMRVELDEAIRLLGYDPAAADRQQAGIAERMFLHLQDIQAVLYQEPPNVDYAQRLVSEAIKFCKTG